VKIIVDRSKCSGIGICESLAPEYFEIAEDGNLALLREAFAQADRLIVESAVSACPARALAIREEK
jgi:ferredoxin